MEKKTQIKKLKKLSRAELLELMIEQSEKIDELTAKLEEAEAELHDRTIAVEEAGSLAEASVKISGVFQAAQEACAIYTENVRRLSESQEARCAELEKNTQEKCDRMLAEATTAVRRYWNQSAIQFQKYMSNPVPETPYRNETEKK